MAKTTKKITSTEDLQNHLSAGGNAAPLGALVYWRRLEGVRIARTHFRAGFEAIGLGDAVSKDPKPEACLNQAAAIASRRSGEQSVRIEMKAKDTHARYAVLARRDHADGLRRYIEEATCSVERGVRQPPPPLVVQLAPGAQPDDQRDAAIADLERRYNDLLNYAMTMELSEALISALSLLGALPLRTGVYFVPAQNLDRVRALKGFIEAETDVQLTIWTIASSDENAAEAKRDAATAFTERFQNLQAEVAAFVAELPAGEEPPVKSVNARVRHFKELEGQVQLYAEILGDYQAELTAQIASAKQALLGAFLGSEDQAA